jgi:hypothetical protein
MRMEGAIPFHLYMINPWYVPSSSHKMNTVPTVFTQMGSGPILGPGNTPASND